MIKRFFKLLLVSQMFVILFTTIGSIAVFNGQINLLETIIKMFMILIVFGLPSAIISGLIAIVFLDKINNKLIRFTSLFVLASLLSGLGAMFWPIVLPIVLSTSIYFANMKQLKVAK